MRELLLGAVPLLVGLAVLMLGVGLEPHPVFHLTSGAADISLSNVAVVGLAVLAGLAALLLIAAAIGAWTACAEVAHLITTRANLPDAAAGAVRAALLLGAAVVGLSVVLGSTVPVRALTLLGGAVFAAIVGRRLLLTTESRRLGWRSRPGGLAGPQGGWELSEPFGLILLFLLSLGLVVGIAQFDRPAPAGLSATEAKADKPASEKTDGGKTAPEKAAEREKSK